MSKDESQFDKPEMDLNLQTTDEYLKGLDIDDPVQEEVMRQTIDYKKLVGRGMIWKDGLVPDVHLDNILDTAPNEIGGWVERFGRDWARFRLQAWIFVGLAATMTPPAKEGDYKTAKKMAEKVFLGILGDIRESDLLDGMVKHDVLTMAFQVPDDLSGLDIDLGD